jgi:predicted O-methyltransferase YrrM
MDRGDEIRSKAKEHLAKAARAVLARASVPGAADGEPSEGAGISVDQAIEALRQVPPLELQRRGYHFQRCDYYSGLNDLSFLAENPDLWHDRSLPPGMSWDLKAQLEAVAALAPYTVELADVPWDPPEGPPRYHWKNDFWGDADAVVHYGLLRSRKPRRVVEIGSGWSSLLMSRALSRNEAEGAPPATVDQVEPFPRHELLSALPSGWVLHETILQRAPLEIFSELEDGDVCFFDGSHVARTASDVVWFFFEVIPRLRPGVLIHVHDIFWPSDYPDEWIFGRAQTWNEQYLLQAFLMYNRDFRPLICNAALAHHHKAELSELFAGTKAEAHGVSVWLERCAKPVS